MAETVKITNGMILGCIKAMAESQEQGVDLMDGVTAADIVGYVDRTLEQMQHKAEKAAENRAKKAKASDELREQVLGFVTAEPQTREQIAANFDDPDITIAKIGARLTQLVASGEVVKEKTKIKNEAGKSVEKMAYKLAE